MKKLIAAALALLMLAAGGCAPVQKDEVSVRVATGIVPVAAFVERVAGDRASVVTMIPPGYSPANYSPTAQEMRAMSDADVYFLMDMPAETANILPRFAEFNKDMRIVDLHEAVGQVYPMLAVSEDGDDDHEHTGTDDPHIWLSPKRAVVIVQTITDTLCEMDPDGAAQYRENAQALIDEISALDEQIKQITDGMERKTFLIFHPSYTYFADDYDLSMLTIETAGKAAGAARMAEVVAQAEESGVKTVFYQSEFSDTQAQAVADEIGGTVTVAEPLSPDYIEALLGFAHALAGEAQ